MPAPVPQIPNKIWQNLPHLLLTVAGGLGLFAGWFHTNISADPLWLELAGGLANGPTWIAGLGSAIAMVANVYTNIQNLSAAAKAPPQAPPGVDQLQHSVATIEQQARQLGNAAVADKLDALHQQMKGVPA